MVTVTRHIKWSSKSPSGNRLSKLDGSVLELTSALRIGLDDPEAGPKWLDREAVFAPARLDRHGRRRLPVLPPIFESALPAGVADKGGDFRRTPFAKGGADEDRIRARHREDRALTRS